jgi:Helicase associated domain
MITGRFLRRSRSGFGCSSSVSTRLSCFCWNEKHPTDARARKTSISLLFSTRQPFGSRTVNTTPYHKALSFGKAAEFSASATEKKLQEDDDETAEDKEEDSRKSYSKYQPRPWEDYYQALVEFYKEHGHCNVQQGTITDPALVYFVKKQRRNRDNLTDEQVEQLNAMDFDWETRAEKQERIWHERYQELVEYKRQNGHCDCPTRYLPNRALGRWVDRQRRLHKNGDLSHHRVELLHKIGFSWAMVEAPIRDTATHDKKWRKQFRKLVDHVHRHGNCV